jgi:hypothetical protein
MRENRRSAGRAAVFLAAIALAGCGGGEGDSGEAVDADAGGAPAETGSAAAGNTSAPGSGDTLAGDPAGLPGGADTAPGNPVPALPGEGEPRTYRLLIVNTTDADAFIYARAAADRVAVDTVAAADSSVVDLRVRADWVDLDAEDPAGRPVASERLDLSEDAVNRWVIGGGGSLVRGDSPAYRRIRPTPTASRASPAAPGRATRRLADPATANGG